MQTRVNVMDCCRSLIQILTQRFPEEIPRRGHPTARPSQEESGNGVTAGSERGRLTPLKFDPNGKEPKGLESKRHSRRNGPQPVPLSNRFQGLEVEPVFPTTGNVASRPAAEDRRVKK